jgi:hypothetical protein
MTRTRVVLLLLLAAAVGLVGFTIKTRRGNAELQTRLAEAHIRMAALESQLRRAKKMEPPHLASEPRPPDPANVSPAKPASAGPAPRPLGLMDLAPDNPQLVNLWIASKRAECQQLYGVLFQKLHLTPAQQETFKDIFAGGIARDADIATAARIEGLKRSDPVVAKLSGDASADQDRELLALLGESGFRAYQDFDRAVPVYGFVDGFAMQTAATEPLTPAQADALRQALIDASPSYLKGARADPAAVDWSSVDRVAQSVLSPTQFAAWKLGVASNAFGSSRVFLELQKVFESAKATATEPSP